MAAAASRGPSDGERDAPRAECLDVDQPVGSLAPQPWMSEPPTRSLLSALSADGHDVRFIGGCVRDAVARRVVHDIDVATTAPPEDVMAQLRRAGLKAVPTGIDHGTVTAVIGERAFEITTLRVDVETDGRHATVAFTDDWVADAARRDLTINAMSCTPDGAVYDYFNGLNDLAHGLVRFVGRPAERIAEDRLRILRFFRFYAHYGRPPADADALAACREQAEGLTDLSGERVRIELLKTLAAPEPADVIRLMSDQAVLHHVLPQIRIDAIARLRMLAWLESRALPQAAVAPDPIRRLAALVLTGDGAGSAAAEAVAGRLRLSNRERDRLLNAVDAAAAQQWPAGPETTEAGVRMALYRRGSQAVQDRLLLDWAGELAAAPLRSRARTPAWTAHLEIATAWRAPEFPLKGRDALALGLPPGPAVGQALADVERWWEEADFRPDRDACLTELQRRADRS